MVIEFLQSDALEHTMAGNGKGAKPVTGERKKRKRPSKKVPTTVLESSSTNFMDLVQQLTGSADDAATAMAAEKRPRAIPAVNDSFLSFLCNNNDNCETSSSSSGYTPAAPPPLAFPQFTLDPILVDDDFYFTGSSSSRSSMDDLSLSSHPDYWYHQMDAMRA